MLFTFEDQETGDLRDTLAPNEAAARLQLGGIWTDIERAAAWQPCEIDGLPKIFREAQADEEAALREMRQPIRWARGGSRRPRRWQI